MNVAFILAGGIGQRTGQDVPKQFICIDNKPIFIYTLENFQKCHSIDAICVACSAGWEAFVEAYAKQYNISKIKLVVTGGENRFMSIFNLLKANRSLSQDDIVLVYDAVRPYITSEIIDDAIEKSKVYGAAVGVIPCFDSMFGNASTDAPVLTVRQNRDLIYRGMGPDAATYGKLFDLFKKYEYINTNMSVADMFLDSDMPVAKSKSSAKCLKLTTAEDFEIFQAILNQEENHWLK